MSCTENYIIITLIGQNRIITEARINDIVFFITTNEVRLLITLPLLG